MIAAFLAGVTPVMHWPIGGEFLCPARSSEQPSHSHASQLMALLTRVR